MTRQESWSNGPHLNLGLLDVILDLATGEVVLSPSCDSILASTASAASPNADANVLLVSKVVGSFLGSLGNGGGVLLGGGLPAGGLDDGAGGPVLGLGGSGLGWCSSRILA